MLSDIQVEGPWDLGLTSGTRGRSRTFINLFLRQEPLPVGLRVREVWSGQQDSNLRTLAPKASPFGHLWNTRKFGFGFRVQSKIQSLKSRMQLASGKGVEPLFTGSEPAVLPVRRPRSVGREGGTRTRYARLEKPAARLFAFIPVKIW